MPFWETANNLFRCGEDQRQPGVLKTNENLEIAIVDAVHMSAYGLPALLKAPRS